MLVLLPQKKAFLSDQIRHVCRKHTHNEEKRGPKSKIPLHFLGIPPGSVIESFVQAALPKGGEECAIGANIGGKRCQSLFSLHREPYKGGRAAARPFSFLQIPADGRISSFSCDVRSNEWISTQSSLLFLTIGVPPPLSPIKLAPPLEEECRRSQAAVKRSLYTENGQENGR